MARDKLKIQLKKDGIVITAVGVFLLVLATPLTIIISVDMFVNRDFDYRLIILFAVLFVTAALGVFFVYFGVTYSNFKKSLLIKKYPDILELVDDLYVNTVYETDDIIISKQAVAAKNHLSSVVKRNDVFLIYDLIKKNKKYYVGKHSYIHNMVRQNLVFVSAKRKIKILIFSPILNLSENVLASYFCNAKIGYSKENVKYAKDKIKNMSTNAEYSQTVCGEDMKSNYLAIEERIKVNCLPDTINWSEVENFLNKSKYGYIVGGYFSFKDGWENSDIIKKANLSESTIEVLNCLNKDLDYVYRVLINSQNNKEDLLREFLDLKYSELSVQLRDRIYGCFMYNITR